MKRIVSVGRYRRPADNTRHFWSISAVVFALLLTSISTVKADCKSDFAELNRIREEAGPYEIAITTHRNHKDIEGRITFEVVPPNSYRTSSTRKNVSTLIVISDGQDRGRAWMTNQDRWIKVGDGDIPHYLNSAPFKFGYLLGHHTRNLRCEGIKIVDGNSYLIFVYQSPHEETTWITAYFDPVTFLPVRAHIDSLEENERYIHVYRFDRTIKIEPPTP